MTPPWQKADDMLTARVRKARDAVNVAERELAKRHAELQAFIDAYDIFTECVPKPGDRP